MHISYLNSEHDPAVLDKWKNSVYHDEASVFDGISGYDYIARHMGYRYVVRNTTLHQSRLNIELENVGFPSATADLIWKSPWFPMTARFSPSRFPGIPDSGSPKIPQSFRFHFRSVNWKREPIRYIFG